MKDGATYTCKQCTSKQTFLGVLGIAFLYLCLSATILSAWSSVANAHPGLRIQSIFPSCTMPGRSVTLKGRGFGGNKTRVTVGEVRATVTTATGRRIVFIVPAGLAAGVQTVTVATPQRHTARTALRIIAIFK